MAAPLPPSLKALIPFIKQASQLEKYDAIMSYYCMYCTITWSLDAQTIHDNSYYMTTPKQSLGKVYATQLGINIMGQDPAAKKYIIGLLTQCETVWLILLLSCLYNEYVRIKNK